MRNNIAQAQNNANQNTMLLMCHPVQSTNYISNVKREVESPKEATKDTKNECVSHNVQVQQKTVECNGLSCKECGSEKSEERLEENYQLKTEKDLCETISPKEVSEENQPCQKTVAETVKVKNMKRKMAEIKHEPEGEYSPRKKLKLDKVKTVNNGSYKDLIKKSANYIKINNGKRKLNIDATKSTRAKFTTVCKKLKKSPKRKLNCLKDDVLHKRLKTSKALVASSLHNSKQNTKDVNKKTCTMLDSGEENAKKITKKSKLHCKNATIVKKLAPVLLDNLLAKNNIDRTIDSVIESGLRTTKDSAVKTPEKCVNCKTPSVKKMSLKSRQVKSKVECNKGYCPGKRKMRKSGDSGVPQVITGVPRRSLQCPRWSNGWTFEGDAFEARVFLNVSICFICLIIVEIQRLLGTVMSSYKT